MPIISKRENTNPVCKKWENNGALYVNISEYSYSMKRETITWEPFIRMVSAHLSKGLATPFWNILGLCRNLLKLKGITLLGSSSEYFVKRSIGYTGVVYYSDNGWSSWHSSKAKLGVYLHFKLTTKSSTKFPKESPWRLYSWMDQIPDHYALNWYH